MKFTKFTDYAEANGVTVTDKLQPKPIEEPMLPLLKKQFLLFFEQCGLMKEAAISIGVNAGQILTWRMDDPEFAEDMDKIRDHKVMPLIEDAIMERCLSGKSDLLLIFMAKANRPDKYDDKMRAPATQPGIVIQILDVDKTKLADTSQPAPKALPLVIDGEEVPKPE